MPQIRQLQLQAPALNAVHHKAYIDRRDTKATSRSTAPSGRSSGVECGSKDLSSLTQRDPVLPLNLAYWSHLEHLHRLNVLSRVHVKDPYPTEGPPERD